MQLTDHQIRTARTMASEGYTIEAIRKHLGLDDGGGWHAVREHVESWQGLKQAISFQLTNLVDETDADERRKIKEVLEERIDRLYEQAHGVADKVHHIRQALDN